MKGALIAACLLLAIGLTVWLYRLNSSPMPIQEEHPKILITWSHLGGLTPDILYGAVENKSDMPITLAVIAHSETLDQQGGFYTGYATDRPIAMNWTHLQDARQVQTTFGKVWMITIPPHGIAHGGFGNYPPDQFNIVSLPSNVTIIDDKGEEITYEEQIDVSAPKMLPVR